MRPPAFVGAGLGVNSEVLALQSMMFSIYENLLITITILYILLFLPKFLAFICAVPL